MERTIPRKDAEFNVAQAVITEMTESHMPMWLVDSEWFLTQLIPAKNAWAEAYAAYENPQGRTPVITFVKREKRSAYETCLRKLILFLQSSTRVTDEERKTMGIAIRPTHHTPVVPPTTYPECEIDTSVLRHLTIHFHDQGSQSKAKPHGVHGTEIIWDILEEEPANVSDLRHSSFDTHTPFTLEFEESERGQTVYFCLRWENTKAEKGPTGPILKAVIP